MVNNKNVIKSVKKEKIVKLIYKMKKDILALPSFQRDFVWKPEQKAKLIESVIRNYPIGTFMLLPYSNNKDLGLNSFVRTDSSKFTPQFYVIDGQQRLRTFLELLDTPGKFQPTEKIGWGSKEYKIYLKVDVSPSKLPSDISKPYFVIPRTLHSAEEAEDYVQQGSEMIMPIEYILSSRHIKKWFKLAFNSRLNSKVKKYRKYVREINKRISRYQCPVESISMKLSPEDHTNIFTLLNEGGTDLTTFDLLSAKLHRESIKLRELWKESRKIYPVFDGYNLDPIYILKVLVLIRKTIHKEDSPACTKRDIERIYYSYYDKDDNILVKEFISDWNMACKYTAKALEQIRSDFGSPQKKYIPYTPMIMTLAALKWFINENEGYSERYKGTIKRKINRWYWGSVFKQAYEKASDDKVSKHFAALRKWVASKRRKVPNIINFRMSKNEIEQRIEEIESGGDARYKAILCLPLVNNAKDIYAYDCLANSILHDHHIYPKRCKEFKDIEPAKLNIICNRILITADTNHEILAKSPYKYLEGVSPANLRKYFLFKDIVQQKLTYGKFIKLRRAKIVDYLYSLINLGETPSI